MEKRRIRLEINGVVCGLITQESEEYMQSIADEVGELMREILEASPYITREAAALTAALSYCDDAKKNGKRAFDLQERVDELEVEAEIWQEDKDEMLKEASAKADAALTEKLQKLETENTALTEAAEKLRETEEKFARLSDENTALREAAMQADTGREENESLLQRIAQLEAENLALRGESDNLREQLSCAENGEPDPELTGKIEKLEKEADELRDKVRTAEQERQGTISAAKRAVEEAKRRMDDMERELKAAKSEAEKYKARAQSPALDLLETEVRRQSDTEKPAVRTVTNRKRKNPLRYDEGLEQEGFVSFFEKKQK